jgi:hypothetical protein
VSIASSLEALYDLVDDSPGECYYCGDSLTSEEEGSNACDSCLASQD